MFKSGAGTICFCSATQEEDGEVAVIVVALVEVQVEDEGRRGGGEGVEGGGKAEEEEGGGEGEGGGGGGGGGGKSAGPAWFSRVSYRDGADLCDLGAHSQEKFSVHRTCVSIRPIPVCAPSLSISLPDPPLPIRLFWINRTCRADWHQP